MVLPASHKVPRASWYSGSRLPFQCFAYGAFTLFGYGFPSAIRLHLQVFFAGPLPRAGLLHHGLGSSAFARHYLRNHFCFLFLRVLRCFSSPRLPPAHYGFMYRYLGSFPRWVPPFGHLWINGYLRLPIAFRSLSRPSSASGAKASALCS